MLRYCAIALLLCLLGPVVSSAQGLRPQKISNTAGNFLAPGTLADDDMFGSAVVNLGDLDGALDPETVTALAVGISADDDGGTNRGAVWILFLTSNGTVKKQQKISAFDGNFTGELADGDAFDSALANLGDLNHDGVVDLAVGAFGDGDERGAVWILFLKNDGTVQAHQKIGDGAGGLPPESLSDNDLFGSALVTLGDVDTDPETVTTLVVGAPGQDGGGAVWTLALDTLGTVRSALKISATDGNFTGQLNEGDNFGNALTTLGDVDGDGVRDLAVGAFGDDDGGPDRGAVWVLFLRSDGQVKRQVKISDTTGNFSGTIENGDDFGFAIAGLGDLNDDGVEDLAVGAFLDDDGGPERGAVWILFLDANGLVQAEQKISDSVSNFQGTLADQDFFGFALANLGDLDGDDIVDLAVGAPGDDDGGGDRGAVWTLFLATDGEVQDEQKISDTVGDFFAVGTLADNHAFGSAIAPLRDLDGDEVADFAVSAPGSDEGRGTVWIFFLEADGTVRDFPNTRLEDEIGGLDPKDRFGSALATLGDVDADPETVTTVVVGAPGDDDGGTVGFDRGAVWILFLKNDGTLQRQQKISDGNGGLATGSLNNLDNFGRSVVSLGDLDGDGAPELAVGAPGDDAGGSNRGTVWILFLRNDGTVRRTQKISAIAGDFTGELDDGDLFGSALANLGDLDGDGVVDLAVGAPGDDDPVEGSSRGAVWILFMRDNGTVKEHQKISDGNGGLPPESLRDNDVFGSALASLGDIDDDTETLAALAVGTPGDDDGGIDQGAVQILFLQADGTVKQRRKISATAGNFTGALDGEDAFGSAVARLGDINDDGVPELVVGAPGDDDGGQDRGAVWEVFELLNAPPRVVGPSIRPQLPTPNQAVDISAVIQDESGISSVVIKFREAGQAAFASDLMRETTLDNWEFRLDVDSLGLELFIEATDLEGALTRVPPSGVRSIPIRFGSGLTKAEPQPNGTEETAYRLISMPLDVDLKSPDDVLEVTLGPRVDVNGVTQWRLFEWQADQEQFVEFLGGGKP